MRFQRLRDRQRGGAVARHAQFEGLQAAQEEKGRQRRDRRACQMAQPVASDPVDDSGRPEDDPGDEIAMASDEFGRRMHDHIGAQFEWALQCRRAEAVVDCKQRTSFTGELGQGRDVYHFGQRIRRRLDEDQPCGRTDRGSTGTHIGRRYE